MASSSDDLHKKLASRIVDKISSICTKELSAIADVIDLSVDMTKYIGELANAVGGAILIEMSYDVLTDDEIISESFRKFKLDQMEKSFNFIMTNYYIGKEIYNQIGDNINSTLKKYDSIGSFTKKIFENIKNVFVTKGIESPTDEMLKSNIHNKLVEQRITTDANKKNHVKPLDTKKIYRVKSERETEINNYVVKIMCGMFEQNILLGYKIPDSVAHQLSRYSEFKKENDKLNTMINNRNSTPDSLKEIIVQRQIVESKILDKQMKEELTHNVVSGISHTGQIASGIALMLGNVREAHDISVVANFACQATMLYAGFQGFGTMACLGPYGLGLAAVASVVSLASGLLSKNEGNSPFLGIYRMMTGIMESLKEINVMIRHNFENLFGKLDLMEKNIIQTIMNIEMINLETLETIKRLSDDMVRNWTNIQDNFVSIDKKLEDIKLIILNEQANAQIKEIGEYISTAFYNHDYKFFPEYRAGLVSRILQPYGASHVSLVGSNFTQLSQPILSLESVLKKCNISVYSNDKKHKYFSKLLEQTDIYLSPIMNSSQLIVELVSNYSNNHGLQNITHELCSFDVYYDIFHKSNKHYGIFIFEVEDSIIILHFCKVSGLVRVIHINIPPLHFSIKLSQALEKMGLSYEYVYSHVDANSYSEEILFDIVNNIIGKNLNINRQELIDNQTNTTNQILTHSIYKTLLYVMSNQYLNTTQENNTFNQINHIEINQMFQCVDTFQKNYQKNERLSNPKHIVKILTETEILSKSLLLAIEKKFNSELKLMLNVHQENIVNSLSVPLTKSDGFLIDLEVTTKASNWKNGSVSHYWRNRGPDESRSEAISNYNEGKVGDIFYQYTKNVRDSAKSIMNNHLKYVRETFEKITLDKYDHMKGEMFSSNIKYKQVAQSVLPFFIKPSASMKDRNLILPLYSDMREKMLELIDNDENLTKLVIYCYCGFGHLSLEYEHTDFKFKISMYLNSKDKLIYNQMSVNKLLVLPLEFSFSNVYSDITFTEQDNIFTWFCGGFIADGSQMTEVNFSHQPGSNGRYYEGRWYVNCPTCTKPRKSLMECASLKNIITTNFKLSSNVITNIIPLLEQNINQLTYELKYKCVNKIFEPLLTDSKTDEINACFDAYIKSLKAIETWDYHTYKMLDFSAFFNNITNKNDIVQLLSRSGFNQIYSNGDLSKFKSKFFKFDYQIHVEQYLKLLCNFDCEEINNFSDIDESSIRCIAKPSGHLILSSMMKETCVLNELFGPFITNNKSTAEIAKNMVEHLENTYSQNLKLINYINGYNSMSSEEKHSYADELIQNIQKELCKINNSSNLIKYE